VSRLWLALILVGFCVPLFVGLGDADLETDEAIYSFAVDRILEVGDWLEPKSSPSETDVFLEKPPLKFWIVAAPIKAGLLPHNEFGLRFWDALAGGLAFCYVFAIGCVLAGPVCGAVAVLLLFIHWPLVFAHGLRTNNMEAPLILCYCGGVYHFLRWSATDLSHRARARHAYGAGLFFVLGFMTKFVAAAFLPLMLAIPSLLSPRPRQRLAEEWRTWLGVVFLVVVLCAPWFVYAQARFGAQLWDTILGEHVLRRMTGYLDPTHVHPWYFYLQQMWQQFENDRMQWLMAAGVATLIVQSVRRRWFEGFVVLVWATVPLAIISAGSSKLYHYAFPYLPPVALAGGYLVSLVVMLTPAPFRRLLEWLEDAVARLVPSVFERTAGGGARRVASVLIAVAAIIAAAAVVTGGVRIAVDGTTLFKSSGVLRPIAVILLAALVTRTSARVARLVVALLALSAMPLAAYRGQIERLPEGKHPMRSAAECLQQVERQTGAQAGVLVDVPDGIWHPLYYYFRRVQPMTMASAPLDPAVVRALSDPAAPRPILIGDATWRSVQALRATPAGVDAGSSPPMIPFLNTLLLLPGPFAACSPEASLRDHP
jgi:4-amino-4-deoxy-L-arabinose transferase-like glycosyltransferase